MKTISIYQRAYINIESDGIIYAREIYDADSDFPFYIFDGARHELTADEKEELRNAIQKA